jgi:hypothetical protein
MLYAVLFWKHQMYSNAKYQTILNWPIKALTASSILKEYSITWRKHLYTNVEGEKSNS